MKRNITETYVLENLEGFFYKGEQTVPAVGNAEIYNLPEALQARDGLRACGEQADIRRVKVTVHTDVELEPRKLRRAELMERIKHRVFAAVLLLVRRGGGKVELVSACYAKEPDTKVVYFHGVPWAYQHDGLEDIAEDFLTQAGNELWEGSSEGLTAVQKEMKERDVKVLVYLRRD